MIPFSGGLNLLMALAWLRHYTFLCTISKMKAVQLWRFGLIFERYRVWQLVATKNNLAESSTPLECEGFIYRVRQSETSVNIQQSTKRHISDDSYLQKHHREYIKPHVIW